MKFASRLCSSLAMLALGVLPSLASAAQPAAGKPFKLYISADMEGVAGVVSEQQLGPAGFEYERFREFMTAEVTTVIETAFAAGVTEKDIVATSKFLEFMMTYEPGLEP